MKADNVCDEKDCPLYGYYYNTIQYPDIEEKLAKFKNSTLQTSSAIKFATFEIIEVIEMAQLTRAYCLNCKHFKKQDIKSILIKQEALNHLIGD